MWVYKFAAAVAASFPFTFAPASADQPDVRSLGGWALVFDAPQKLTSIFVADESKGMSFGFACPAESRRGYTVHYEHWQSQSVDKKSADIVGDVICDGSEVESIPFRFTDNQTFEVAIKPTTQSAVPDQQRFIETDRNVLSAIAAAKRYCTVTFENQTLELPLQHAFEVIAAYIYSCKSLGRW